VAAGADGDAARGKGIEEERKGKEGVKRKWR
jgi:hypothetical protein